MKEQALDVLGISWLRFWRPSAFTEFSALNGISVTVDQGERLGIVGRNGAGKTTLLKLITGNFAPSSGDIVVNGRVQALMNVGLGFHPEFTGYDNVRSALAYSGLSKAELDAALDDVITFAELGEFLHQPVKTYSLGMQARLMFAAATAVKPEILIIDEILGAGDAYFSAKSSHRMERLAASGCTLLLVSHAMQQVLQFCSRVIWLERGEIVMEGEALPVVKAYEEFTQRLEWEASQKSNARKSVLADPELRNRILADVLKQGSSAHAAQHGGLGESSGGISRWSGEAGLCISAIRVKDKSGRPAIVAKTGEALEIEIEVEAEAVGEYPCFFVLVLFTEDGKVLSRHCSEKRVLRFTGDQTATYSLRYEPLLLGRGQYFFSAALYKELDLRKLSVAKFYDLLSRSYEFKVLDELPDDPSLFHHPSSWIESDPAASHRSQHADLS
ncbi:MAG: polysaccharide ABC transporter ATP-binding protein [Rubricoccaceae bacterium]|nr:polysaccharide ABC transporter ATP-binding protein [Rubricoccaceae bacterium]